MYCITAHELKYVAMFRSTPQGIISPALSPPPQRPARMFIDRDHRRRRSRSSSPRRRSRSRSAGRRRSRRSRSRSRSRSPPSRRRSRSPPRNRDGSADGGSSRRGRDRDRRDSSADGGGGRDGANEVGSDWAGFVAFSSRTGGREGFFVSIWSVRLNFYACSCRREGGYVMLYPERAREKQQHASMLVWCCCRYNGKVLRLHPESRTHKRDAPSCS